MAENENQVEEVQQEVKEESSKEQNLRILRERAEEAERQARDIRRRNEELEGYVKNYQQQAQKPVQADEDDLGLDDDSYLETKHFKKYHKTQKQQIDELKNELRNVKEEAVTTMLRTQFKDFDSVVNEDNIAQWAKRDPIGYRTMLSNPNLSDRGYVAYKAIINNGIIKKEDEVDRKLAENQTKPKSSASVAARASDSPLVNAAEFGRRVLSEEQKEQIRQRVSQIKKGI